MLKHFAIVKWDVKAFCDLTYAYSVEVCRHLGFAPQGGPTGPYLEGVHRHIYIKMRCCLSKKLNEMFFHARFWSFAGWILGY